MGVTRGGLEAHSVCVEDKTRPLCDTFLIDPAGIRIYDSIPYDYEKSFGKPDGSHPMRSSVFETLRPWIATHPGGTVVELACGLPTQFQRCDDAKGRWLCVDIPDAIEARERFLPPMERRRHVRKSALDLTWMDEVDASRGVYVTAQDLFMYFEEKDVRRLIATMIEGFPGIELMFELKEVSP